MSDEDAPILNYAPLPPRPRRTKLVLAGAAIIGAAGIVIAVGAWRYQLSRAQAPVLMGGTPAWPRVNWGATQPSSAPATPGSAGSPGEDLRGGPGFGGDADGTAGTESAAGQ